MATLLARRPPLVTKRAPVRPPPADLLVAAPGTFHVPINLDAAEESIAAAFRAAAFRLQGSAPLAALADASTVDMLDWASWDAHLDSVRALIADRAADAARLALLDLGEGAAVLVGAAMPIARRWAAEWSASKVVAITDSTRAALRDLTGRALREGWSVDRFAAVLRPCIGLTPGHAQALATYHARLLADGEPRAGVLADRYAERLLAYRSRNIARTESVGASNAGRLTAWGYAQAAGSIGPDATKEWIVADDDRLCPECAGLDGAIVGLHDAFDGADAPPLHPSCRCTVVIASFGTVDGVELGSAALGDPDLLDLEE